jgi:hypothetical protein
MSETELVAQYVAITAEDLIPTLIKDSTLPGIVTRAGAEAAIDAAVYQDAGLSSKRVWAGVLGLGGLVLSGVAAAMLLPEAKELAGPVAPLIATVLGSVASGLAGAAALVSKAQDPRPAR